MRTIINDYTVTANAGLDVTSEYDYTNLLVTPGFNNIYDGGEIDGFTVAAVALPVDFTVGTAGTLTTGTIQDTDSSIVKVLNYGLASDIVLNDGSSFYAEAGSQSDNITIANDGSLLANPGATLSGIVVQSGGSFSEGGASVFGLTLQAGGVFVQYYGAETADLIETGATGYAAGLMNNTDVEGTLVLQTDGTYGTGTFVDGTLHSGNLQVDSGTTLSGTIDFTGTGNDLEIFSGASITSGTALKNLAVGDTIEVIGGTVTINPTGNADVFDVGFGTLGSVTATVTQGETLYTSAITGGEEILVADIACFAAGTRILTSRGEVPVEQLKAGDKIRIMKGGQTVDAKITSMCQRTVDVPNHPIPENVSPILFEKNCFGDGVPHTDLMLSPDHGVYYKAESGEEIFMLARDFRNGRTIRQVSLEELVASPAFKPLGGKITYHHIELESHEVIFANGMAAESFLDTGNHGFDGKITDLHPDFSGDLKQAAQQIRDTQSKFRVPPYWDPAVVEAHDRFDPACNPRSSFVEEKAACGTEEQGKRIASLESPAIAILKKALDG